MQGPTPEGGVQDRVMKRGKRYKASEAKVERKTRYALGDALKLATETAGAKFDETVELAVRLGVDPRQADQNVRGTVVLPHGTGKSVRVLVFAKGEKIREAEEAGADHVGGEELAKRVADESWLDFDKVVATPDMMGSVGRLGKILGPRGLMPNPKTGTVTMELAKTVRELKGGRIEFRVDKQSNVAVSVGKLSFGETQISENVNAFIDAIVRAKPATAKGPYLLSATLCSTMSPGIKLDTAALLEPSKK